MITVALIVAIISAGFWLYEISNGINNANKILEKADKKVFGTVRAGPRILFGFWPFVADLLISSFFLAFFGIAGSVTGMITGLACSNLFSIWIILKMNK